MQEPKPINGFKTRSTADLVVLITVISAAVLSITASGGVIVSGWINAARLESQVISASAKSDEKLDIIHEQTNSNLTGVNERLEKAYNKIEALEKLLSAEKDR